MDSLKILGQGIVIIILYLVSEQIPLRHIYLKNNKKNNTHVVYITNKWSG